MKIRWIRFGAPSSRERPDGGRVLSRAHDDGRLTITDLGFITRFGAGCTSRSADVIAAYPSLRACRRSQEAAADTPRRSPASRARGAARAFSSDGPLSTRAMGAFPSRQIDEAPSQGKAYIPCSARGRPHMLFTCGCCLPNHKRSRHRDGDRQEKNRHPCSFLASAQPMLCCRCLHDGRSGVIFRTRCSLRIPA